MRLLDHDAHPFQAEAAHPPRRTGDPFAEVGEQPADGDDERAAEVVAVPADELLLQGRAHAHQHHVRFGRSDAVQNSLLLLGFEVAVVVSHAVPLSESLGRTRSRLGHLAGGSTEQEEPPLSTQAPLQEVGDQVRAVEVADEIDQYRRKAAKLRLPADASTEFERQLRKLAYAYQGLSHAR